MIATTHVQAVLLLTARFGAPGNDDERPLSPGEWGRFASWLKNHGLLPEALLERDPADVLALWRDAAITTGRVRALLGRAAALGLAMEKWERAGLWVLTRADPAYPSRLKRLLGTDSPPLLFGCGNAPLLNRGGLAVVGSREAGEADLAYAAELGRLAAAQGRSIVSGAARGVDEAAMLGTLEGGGTVIGVLADSLLRTATSARYRQGLRSRNVVLVSPFYPEAGFNVGNAMSRNKYIYSLADAAVVVTSAVGSGGTWSGAIENLKRRWVPLWVRPSADEMSGNTALMRQGARALAALPVEISSLVSPEDSYLRVSEPGADLFSGTHTTQAAERDPPAETPYQSFLRQLEGIAKGHAVTAHEIEEQLALERSRVSTWLKRAVAEGWVEKLAKPVRYAWRDGAPAQDSMFG